MDLHDLHDLHLLHGPANHPSVPGMPDARPGFYEFFAGAGLARAGLGEGWRPLFANDLDPMKAAAYRLNGDAAHFRTDDVWRLSAADLPGRADLAWASSPCQDLSLAGLRGGLAAERSGAFWGFHRLLATLADEGRAPATVVVENVCGLLSSRGGADFAALCGALADLGYGFGALEIDAALWTPQSRPRLFVVAARGPVEPTLLQPAPGGPFHPRRLVEAVEALPPPVRHRALWWRLPAPAARNTAFADLLEPDDLVAWHAPARTARLLELLSPLHARRLHAGSGRRVGTVYRRTRVEDGRKVQRAELRLDGVAGCLRTPAGGSSRQFVLVADEAGVRTRGLTPREAARLMGLPDEFRLPASTTAALQVVGDAVSVPAVRWLAAHLLEPLVRGRALRAA